MSHGIDWSAHRGLIYARESMGARKKRRGIEVHSCAEQIAMSRVWCERAGLPVVAVYQDDVSASDYSTKAREDWALVVEALEQGHADVVVCFEVSRLSRDAEVWGPVLAMARRRGVIFVVDGKPYDLSNNDDEFMLKVHFLIAEREVRQTSKRIQRTAGERAAAGSPWGRCPYGYQRVYHPQTGQLQGQEPHPDQAAVVKRIFELMASGHRAPSVASFLNNEGIPSKMGGEWTASSVNNVATRKAYIGKRVHHADEHDATWPALVDEAVFWQVQRLMQQHTRPPVAVRREYLLSGLMRCPQCNYKGQNFWTKSHRSRFYRCMRGHYVIVAEPTEEWVTEVVLAYLRREENFTRLHAQDDRVLAEAQATLDQALTEQAELEAAAGTMRPALVAAMDRAIQERIDSAREALRVATVPPVLRGLIGPEVDRRWETMELGQRRVVIAAAVDITVQPSGRRTVPVAERVVVTPKAA